MRLICSGDECVAIGDEWRPVECPADDGSSNCDACEELWCPAGWWVTLRACGLVFRGGFSIAVRGGVASRAGACLFDVRAMLCLRDAGTLRPATVRWMGMI